MPTLVSLLQSVPDVVWSGLIASALTLSGVLISNRSNTNRLQIQLEHDAAEKSKERTANLRREVYLTTAEELTKANAHFASLPQSDLAKTNAAEGLQGFLAAAAKLQLVAEPHTALLMNSLVATYGELLLRVLARLIPLQKARREISLNDDMYSKAQAEVTRVLAEMARFNEAAKIDDIVFGALQRAFTSYREQAEGYSAARSRAWDDFERLNVEFTRQLLTDMQLVGGQQIPVLIEIRRDLGLNGDIEEFRKQMDTNCKRMSGQIDMLLRSLRPDA